MNVDLLLMLAFLVAVCAVFVWFATQLLKSSRRERSASKRALEQACERLETGKITSQEFEALRRGLEHS